MNPPEPATASSAVAAVIERFNDAVNRHDVGAMVDAMTPDAVFEDTQPPDGRRYTGAEIAEFFERLFGSARERSFEAEEVIVAGEQVVVCWLHRWVDLDGGTGHVRGIDVFTVRDGKVARKLSYVKG